MNQSSPEGHRGNWFNQAPQGLTSLLQPVPTQKPQLQGNCDGLWCPLLKHHGYYTPEFILCLTTLPQTLAAPGYPHA